MLQAITYLRAIRGPHLVTLMGNKELNTEADVASRDLRGGSKVQGPQGIPLSPHVSLCFILLQTIWRSYNSWHRAMSVHCNVCLAQSECGDGPSSRFVIETSEWILRRGEIAAQNLTVQHNILRMKLKMNQ
jgi:hypothetical protein